MAASKLRRRPTYKRTCHIVTVNASGGQINDKSNALEEKREEEVREAEVPVPTANCAPKNAFGSPLRALLGEIVSYRPDGSAHALPEGSALGGLLDCQADAEALMVARIVVLVLPSQVPDQGIVRSQDSTERSWFKVSRFCYMLMKYSCDRRHVYTFPGVGTVCYYPPLLPIVTNRGRPTQGQC